MICEGCKKEVFRARWVNEKQWLCEFCDPGVSVEKDAKNVPGAMFPFTTMNIGNDPSKPIKVQSLRHLRKLEAQHGVQSMAFNQDSSNFDHAQQLRRS